MVKYFVIPPMGLPNEQFDWIGLNNRQKAEESVLINQFVSLLKEGYLFLAERDFCLGFYQVKIFRWSWEQLPLLLAKASF